MFPPCYLTRGQTMVQVMKIIETSSKMSHAYIAALNVPDLAAGHCQPTPLPQTPGHSWASLGQSLLGSQLLSPESWWAQNFVCSLQESVFPVLCTGSSMVGLTATSFKRSYAIPRSAEPRAPGSMAVHC